MLVVCKSLGVWYRAMIWAYLGIPPLSLWVLSGNVYVECSEPE